MANTAEKIQDSGQPTTQKTVEQWLREDVVKACEEIMADPSKGILLNEAFAESKAKFKAKRRA